MTCHSNAPEDCPGAREIWAGGCRYCDERVTRQEFAAEVLRRLREYDEHKVDFHMVMDWLKKEAGE